MAVILFIHRYLGLAVGLLMVLWCLSGFVMMYQSFPATEPQERIRGLEPLRLTQCCDVSRIDLLDDESVTDFRIEMLAGEPVIRIPDLEGAFSLRTGLAVAAVTPGQVAAVARAWAAGNGVAGAPRPSEVIEMDQWTVASARRNAPVHRVRFDDPAGTEIYVSGQTGQVFQDTDRRERILSWLGAIPHWLYLTELRQNGAVWTEIVVWSSIVGVFLTVTGVFVGIVRFRPMGNGRWIPYRGLFYWHHILGLVFGILTLTWTFSGLMTMGPWSVLQSAAGGTAQAYTGAIPWAEAKRLIAAAPGLVRPDTAQIEAAPSGGTLHAVIMGTDGEPRSRVDAAGAPAPLSEAEVRRVAGGLGPPVAALTLLRQEDDYYYGHHRTVPLPVWRLGLADPARTQLYIDSRTGAVVRAVDRPARTRRWLETGLHDLDFAWLRRRPVWDIVVLPLLAGVTLACLTGVWMAWRRLKRDIAVLTRRRRAPQRTATRV